MTTITLDVVTERTKSEREIRHTGRQGEYTLVFLRFPKSTPYDRDGYRILISNGSSNPKTDTVDIFTYSRAEFEMLTKEFLKDMPDGTLVSRIYADHQKPFKDKDRSASDILKDYNALMASQRIDCLFKK